MGWRKYSVTVLAMLLATLAVSMKWIEGMQFAAIVSLGLATYVGGNVMAKREADAKAKSDDTKTL